MENDGNGNNNNNNNEGNPNMPHTYLVDGGPGQGVVRLGRANRPENQGSVERAHQQLREDIQRRLRIAQRFLTTGQTNNPQEQKDEDDDENPINDGQVD